MNFSLICQQVELENGLDIRFIGPPLEEGPLPTLFYLALSAQDSLTLDPFNQPVAYLAHLPLRIFSITLPGHEENLPPTGALANWAQKITEGTDCINEFIRKVQFSLTSLESKNIFLKDKLGIAGLSRGAFVAAHLAAKFPPFRYLLGFAPLTTLSCVKEFSQFADHPLVTALDLKHLSPQLFDRHIRFYIGNLDTRVNTRFCFDLIELLSQTAQNHKLRSPRIELMITPSIGHQGHGTSTPIFHQGAQWIAEKLLSEYTHNSSK